MALTHKGGQWRNASYLVYGWPPKGVTRSVWNSKRMYTRKTKMSKYLVARGRLPAMFGWTILVRRLTMCVRHSCSKGGNGRKGAPKPPSFPINRDHWSRVNQPKWVDTGIDGPLVKTQHSGLWYIRTSYETHKIGCQSRQDLSERGCSIRNFLIIIIHGINIFLVSVDKYFWQWGSYFT